MHVFPLAHLPFAYWLARWLRTAHGFGWTTTLWKMRILARSRRHELKVSCLRTLFSNFQLTHPSKPWPGNVSSSSFGILKVFKWCRAYGRGFSLLLMKHSASAWQGWSVKYLYGLGWDQSDRPPAGAWPCRNFLPTVQGLHSLIAKSRGGLAGWGLSTVRLMPGAVYWKHRNVQNYFGVLTIIMFC